MVDQEIDLQGQIVTKKSNSSVIVKNQKRLLKN